MEKTLTVVQEKTDTDLWIIGISTLVVFGAYMMVQSSIDTTISNTEHFILLRTMYGAFIQFGLTGLGITIVSIFRKESFRQHGLNKKNIVRSILLSILCVIPYLIFTVITEGNVQYMPLQGVKMTKEILNSGFPVNILGMGIIALVWGFFEGFNYIVISDKINARYPSNNKWLNWGGIICTIACILLHGAIGLHIENIFEILATLCLVYGMIMVREKTDNAWGTIFIFLFFWNAF